MTQEHDEHHTEPRKTSNKQRRRDWKKCEKRGKRRRGRQSFSAAASEQRTSSRVMCHYCDRKAIPVRGAALFGLGSRSARKWFWRCDYCEAHVGCHEDTKIPYGTLANKELRKRRAKAHAVFDVLWKSKLMTREDAYGELATRMQVPVASAHIGLMDAEQCILVEKYALSILSLVFCGKRR